MSKIKVKDLDLYYGSHQALKKINMEISSNEVTAFIGPSGCGKSTTGRAVLRLFDKTSGNVYFEGENFVYNNKKYKLKNDIILINKDEYESDKITEDMVIVSNENKIECK